MTNKTISSKMDLMGFKDEETRKAYYRDYQRQRRAKQAGKAEVLPPASEVKVARALTPPLSPKEPAESPSALATIEETKMKSKQIDGQVHLLSGSMGIFRNPQVVFDMSRRLLLSQGWCVWQYPTLENETFVIMNGSIAPKVTPPLDLPKLTLNPDRIIEVELQKNIPGSVYC